MAWLIPAALSGLALIAGPIVIHLLTRQRAPRVPFPSVRFVRPSVAAAVRLRTPSDAGLLVIRAAIIAVAALAAAQPLLLTRWRLVAWNGRTARAIVIDTSESMRRVDGAGRQPAALAADVAGAESSSAFRAVRVETGDIPDGLTRAARLLDAAPPARREVVIVSDFQRGTLPESALAAIPPDIGVRLVRAGQPIDRREIPTTAATSWQGEHWTPAVRVDARSTQTTWKRDPAGADVGLTLVTSAGEERAGAATVRAAASLGALLQRDRPVRIVFPGSSKVSASVEPLRTPWMVNVVLALRRGDAREYLARTGEQRGVLVLETSATAGSVAAAALIHAVLAARAHPIVDPEAEIATVSDADLARWRRDPLPIDANAWPRAERSDARWLWGIALVLLAVESWMRRTRATAPRHVDATAA